MLIYKVGFQFGHSFPTVLESFAFGVGTRCAYELDVRITCLDGLDKRFQTLEVKILPLFVSHCKILHVERCRVSHFGAFASPYGRGVAVGKLNEVETVLDVGLELVQGDMCFRVVPVLVLACHAHIEHRQRLGTDVFGKLEVLEEAQSVALEVVGEVAMVEGKLPTVAVQRTVLHRTYRVFPLVTVLKCFAFDNTSARESQHSGVNIGKSLAEVAAHTVLAVLESVYGEEADVFECEGELSDVSAWVLDIRVAEGELCLARFDVCSKITPYLFIIITQAGLKMEKSDQDNLISLFKPVFIDFKALYGSIILFYKIHRCD